MSASSSSSSSSSVHSFLKGARYTYLVIEAIHFFVWFISMIVEQVHVVGPASSEASWIRLAHGIMALHFVAPITAIAVEHEQGKRMSGWQFFIALTVFGTDLWSLLENALHLESVEYAQYVALEKALAGICLAVSTLWIGWYAIAYFYYRSTATAGAADKPPGDQHLYKKLDDEEAGVVANASGTFSPSLSVPQLRRK